MGIQDQLTDDLDAFFDGGARRDPDPTDASPTREAADVPDRDWSDVPLIQAMQVQAMINSAEEDIRERAETWLDKEVERVEKSGECGCTDGPHFDRDGVLQAMIELNTTDIDAAWKAWHDSTLKPDVRFMTVEDAAEELGERLAAKEKYKISRYKPKPLPGNAVDHNAFDAALDDVLSR